MVEDLGVVEVLDEVVEALQPGVGEVADLAIRKWYLLASELAGPALVLELVVEELEVGGVEEVDEPVSHVAVILRYFGNT